MSDLLHDIRYAFRSLRLNPGFAVVAVMSLALGIAAATSVYTLIDAVLLRPVSAVDDPETLVENTRESISLPLLQALRAESDTLQDIAGYGIRTVALGSAAQPEIVLGATVSANYFSVLGLRPVLGRTFLAEDDSPGANPVAVIGHGLWQRSFGATRDLSHLSVRINGVNFQIIGVTPAGFHGTRLSSIQEIWFPIASSRRVATGFVAQFDINSPTFMWLSFIGRLKPRNTPQQASAEVDAFANRREVVRNFNNQRAEWRVAPLNLAASSMDRDNLVRFLGVLAATTAIALAIACANVANLLLLRGATRRKEIAIRVSVGASKLRLIRQLLTESLVLAVVGGSLGLLIGVWTIDLISNFELPGAIAIRPLSLGLNSHVLVFALAVTFITGIVFGLVPAIHAAEPDPIYAIKGVRVVGPSRRLFFRHGVIASQLAMSVVLSIGAGLFAKSLQSGLAIDLGFDSGDMATASVDLGLQRYERPRAMNFYEQVSERVRALPGVQSATWAQVTPLSTARRAEGLALEANPDDRIDSLVNIVGADFFRTLRIPMRAGRDFSKDDMVNSASVIVVNEAMASKIWGKDNPIGRRVQIRSEWFTIVGVAADAKYQELKETSQPVSFLPLTRFSELAGVSRTTLMVRMNNDLKTGLPAIRREIGVVDGTVPVTDLNPFQQKIDRQLLPQRFGVALLTMFSTSAMVLAAIGIYGVVAFNVKQRFQEIGIRLALGAPKRDVLRLSAAAGLLPAIVGIFSGVVVAMATTRLISAFLFGVPAKDPGTFMLAAGVLLLVSVIASYIPARRATRIDPAAALRWE